MMKNEWEKWTYSTIFFKVISMVFKMEENFKNK